MSQSLEITVKAVVRTLGADARGVLQQVRNNFPRLPFCRRLSRLLFHGLQEVELLHLSIGCEEDL
eukprot:2667220-Amphidinium_carterae.2